MKTYKVQHTDLVVSPIAYGCLFLVDFKELLKKPLSAAASTRMVRKTTDEPLRADTIAKAARLIHTAYNNGITFFDHADGYGAGKCEEVFGEVLKQSPGLRNKVVIQSKCGIRFAEDPPGDPAHQSRLEIKVTNLWPNRLIGDKQPGASKIAFATFDPFRADSPLLVSGHLGPVTLLPRSDR